MFFPTSDKVLAQHEALRTVVLMRTIALLCQLLVLALTQFWLGIALRLPPLLITMALLAVLNVWTWRRMRQTRPVGAPEVFTQLLADIAALSVLLYFSGGATNPFVSFYLPVLAVAAALLPWHYALLLAALAVIAYSAMTNLYIPLLMNDPERAIRYHLAGMWANFAVSATLITWFVAHLSHTVRQRDAQLALARERHLESERVIALGMQAANAAHEIGTPLSTVAIIAGELLRESGADSPLAPYREEFATIEGQIGLCKTALERMGAQAGDAPGTNAAVPVTAWLTQFIDTWRLRHPASRIALTLMPSDAHVFGAPSLAQILTTLLDNAAQAVASNNQPIELSMYCERDTVIVQVLDNGPGIAPDLLARLGYQQIGNGSNGRGIGLLLAFATARQVGAIISLTPRERGGTNAKLTIPAA